MATVTAMPVSKVPGGSFLIEERHPEEIFTPEDFTEEHRMIAETTRQFMDNEVLPVTDQLEKHDWDLSRRLIKQAAELGLIGANIPEEFGGLGLDQTSGALVGENIGRSASFATTLGAELARNPFLAELRDAERKAAG